jgi:RNA polymerase sigma-70 factor, ECF subfamily
MTVSEQGTITYCVVPRELADDLHEYLREHWQDEPAIKVVVDRRRDDRRAAARREGPGAPPDGRERRTVRSPHGRRIAERRTPTTRAPAPPPPRKSRRYFERLTFVLRRLPSSQAAEDVETARLVVEYQLGDRSALEDIYLRYFDRIYAYARVALKDSHEAEDVTQQVFMRVIDALPRYRLRAGVPFRAWLFRIARNAMLDARGAQLRTLPEEPAQLEARQERAVSPVAEEALDWYSDADLYQFIEHLPPSQREVLVLRYVLDMSTKEIATALDRTPGGVRQILSRALRTLNRQLVAAGRKRGSTDRSPMIMRTRRTPVLTARPMALRGGQARASDPALARRPAGTAF